MKKKTCSESKPNPWLKIFFLKIHSKPLEKLQSNASHWSHCNTHQWIFNSQQKQIWPIDRKTSAIHSFHSDFVHSDFAAIFIHHSHDRIEELCCFLKLNFIIFLHFCYCVTRISFFLPSKSNKKLLAILVVEFI